MTNLASHVLLLLRSSSDAFRRQETTCNDAWTTRRRIKQEALRPFEKGRRVYCQTNSTYCY